MKIPKEPQKRDRTPESDEDPRASSKWPRTKKGGLENLDKLPEDVWVRHVLPEAMLEESFLKKFSQVNHRAAELTRALVRTVKAARLEQYLQSNLLGAVREQPIPSPYTEDHEDRIDAFLEHLRLRNPLTAAKFFMGNGKYTQAELAYKEAVRRWPANIEGYVGLSDALSQDVDRRAERNALLRRIIEKFPEHPMGYYLLGLDLRFNEAAFEEAERSYKQAVFLKEDCAESHEQLGWLLYRRPERVPEAISHFRRAIVLKGDDWRDHFNLAFRLYRERTSDALVSIQDAIDALPAKSREKSSRAEKAFITGKLHFCCALMQFHQGSLKDADVSCEQAMRVLGVRLDKPIPNRVKTKKVGLSKVFAMRGYIKNAQQCFAEAIPCFEEALALDPEEAAAGHGLGDAYRKLSNYREALVAYQKDSAASWERDSNDMKHARYLGIAESALKGSEYDVAEKYFLRTIWKQHLRYDSYLGIGLARHGKRRFHEAVSAYKEASKSRPAAPEAYQGAVSAMVDAGAGVEAVRVHQAYLQSWGAPFGRTHSLASLIQNLQFAVVNPPIQDWFRDADFVIRKSKL